MENELLKFDWEGESDDFFGIKTAVETPPADTPKPKDTKDDEEETKKPVEAQEAEEAEDDFFEASSKTTESEDEGTVDENDKPAGHNSIYTDVYKDLKETGLFKHVEIEEDEDIDADRLFELQQEEYETEMQKRLENWATNELDEDAKAFIKFKTQGGDTQEFFKAYSKGSELPTGDIEDENFQDEVIRFQLKEEGWDRDEIEDRINYLTDSGRKQKVAEKYNEKIKEKEEKNRQSIVKQAEQNKLLVKQQKEQFKNTLKDTLEEIEEINGFKIAKEEKAKLLNLLTKEDHKISETKSITGFQKQLAEVFQDSKKLILLAKLIETDFDMTDFEKKVRTKTTKQVKSNLEQRKSLRPNNSGSSLDGSSLADLFN